MCPKSEMIIRPRAALAKDLLTIGRYTPLKLILWNYNLGGLGRTPGATFGWNFGILMFYDLKKFTSKSFYQGGQILFWSH